MPRRRLARWLLAVASLVSMGAASGDLRLIRAVERGDRTAIRMLLTQRVDVNAVDADGGTALFLAVQRNDVNLVEMLLRAGARARTANRRGVTPLYRRLNANPAMVKTLLDAGVDPMMAPPEETMLMAAARRQHANGHVAARSPRQPECPGGLARSTALVWAAAQENSVVKPPVEQGADVGPPSGFSALVRARAGDANRTIRSTPAPT